MNNFKKILCSLGVICATALFGVFIQATQAQAAESIQDYVTDITINSDSSLLVQEQISYDFGTEQRHGIFRNIPYKYKARGGTFKLRIDNVAVTDEKGESYNFETSTSGGELQIKIGDANTTITGQHIYKISYTVRRAVNYFDDHDELYWNAVGTGWEVPIAKATSIIHGPADISQTVCYTGPENSTEQACSIEGGYTKVVTFKSTSQLEPGEGLTVVVGMPAGTLTKPTTAQKLWDIFQDNGVLLLPLLVLLGMLYLWNKTGRDPKRKSSVVAQYEAPDKLSPLYMSTLAHSKTSNRDIAAEVIYLASQGFLTIQRLETTKLMLFKGTDYEFKKIDKDASSLPKQTRAFLDELFPGGQDSIKLSELKKDVGFGRALIKIKSDVMTELVDLKYFKSNPSTVTGIWIAVAIFFGTFGSFLLGNFIGYLGTIAVIVSAIIVFIFAFLMPAKTQKGVEATAHVEGLKEYLSVAEKDRLKFHNAPEKNPEVFEILLPFAIALGVETAWANQFKDLTKAPSWYNDSTGNAFSAAAFSHSISDFNTSMQSVATAVTTSSSGGSGFSGGGSGGGGGGGGGGSW